MSIGKDVDLHRSSSYGAAYTAGTTAGATDGVAGDSKQFAIDKDAIGGWLVTSVTTAATVTFWVAQAPSGGPLGVLPTAQNWCKLKDNTNSDVTQAITVNGAYNLPAGAMAFGAVKLVIDTGSATFIPCRKS